MVVALCFVLVLLFVPETFWDRTPRPPKSRNSLFASFSAVFLHLHARKSGTDFGGDGSADMRKIAIDNSRNTMMVDHATIAERRRQKHVGFADQSFLNLEGSHANIQAATDAEGRIRGSGAINDDEDSELFPPRQLNLTKSYGGEMSQTLTPASHRFADRVAPRGEGPQTPGLHNFNSPYYVANEKLDTDYWKNEHDESEVHISIPHSNKVAPNKATSNEKLSALLADVSGPRYTTLLRARPPKTYLQTLKPWNGKLRDEDWFLVVLRPFILFAYPAILWSTLVYSLSIGWLIVLSESVSIIYIEHDSYHFTPLQAGLVYISPFIGGILGTAVAGKVSDIIVRSMSQRNAGVYEPEFRLVMAIPVTISTCIGLMGFGWSAEEKNNWIVPTVFFGIISFGCSLGSTISITFAVDSYRQFAGETLVTLNFSKSKRPCRIFRSDMANPYRHLPRSRFLPLLQSLARIAWVEGHLCRYWRHTAGLLTDHDTHVHLRQKGTNVDGTQEPDGEVLVLKMRYFWLAVHSFCIARFRF